MIDTSVSVRSLAIAALNIAVALAFSETGNAEKQLAAGQFQEALRSLALIQERTADWHILASRAYDGLNDPTRAVAEAEAALAINPRNEAAHVQLGLIFLAHNTPAAHTM